MHKLIRENDEYFCTRCSKRWSIDEDPPKCLDRRENNLRHIQQLRDKINAKH